MASARFLFRQFLHQRSNLRLITPVQDNLLVDDFLGALYLIEMCTSLLFHAGNFDGQRGVLGEGASGRACACMARVASEMMIAQRRSDTSVTPM